MKILISLIIVQMNLVCGGYNTRSGDLNSCEVNKVGERSWSPMTSLPGERAEVRGITIGSEVFMIGNIGLVNTIITSSLQYSGGGSKTTNIFSLDLNTEEWKLVDHLNVSYIFHAVSSVDLTLFNFCK